MIFSTSARMPARRGQMFALLGLLHVLLGLSVQNVVDAAGMFAGQSHSVRMHYVHVHVTVASARAAPQARSGSSAYAAIGSGLPGPACFSRDR